MKKPRLILLVFFSIGLMIGANAQQDTIKHLIFSEHRGGWPYDFYLEIANVGDESIDLSRVTLADLHNKAVTQDENGQWRVTTPVVADKNIRLSGTLEPGETWVVMNVSDKFLVPDDPSFGPDHRLDLMAMADTIIHVQNAWGFSPVTIPEWEMWGFDSIDNAMFWDWGARAYALFNHLDNGDSIMIDQVCMELDGSGNITTGYKDVAGVVDAAFNSTLVRKATVTTGNMVWANSAGIDATDSEWQVIPNQDRLSRRSFTTVKTHGNFQVDITSSEVDVNLNNATMTVPWGVYRGDSILNLLDIGPGQAWGFEWNASVEDSTHTIIQDGDVLTIYTTGNELQVTDFALTSTAPTADEARVFPVRDKRYNDNNPPPTGYWVQPFYVTKEQPVIDSIGDVPYATRVDTLFKYLEKAPEANWEIVWKDGVVRADLQNGDILKVTAEDGSTVKEYYIDVQEYAASDNISLSAITWPDKSEFLEGWNNDTIPQFTPNKTVYTVLVPYGMKNVPALVAHPANINTKVETQRAVSLTGSLEQRTTVFFVTSESDTLTQEYQVIFEMEKDPAKVQNYYGTPFISEIAANQRSWMSYLEIVNPGTVPLDLSEYMIVVSRSNAVNTAEAITGIIPAVPQESGFLSRYSNSYVPGFKYYNDTISWMNDPGILSIDGNVDPVVEPGGVFTMVMANLGREDFLTDYHRDIINVQWYPGGTTEDLDPTATVANNRGVDTYWLFKIVGDSILDGNKPVGDPADFELVDVIGDYMDGNWTVAGEDLGSVFRGTMRPKPYIYTGARSLTESIERLGSADSSAWEVQKQSAEFGADDIPNLIGSHTMDVITVYISTVTSSVYLVSDGYEGEQTIQGDLASTTVSAFMENIDKADPLQGLKLTGSDGTEKAADAAVADGDQLVVTSADSSAVTTYTLIDLPLSSDAVLTLANDESDYTINIDGADGTITGVVYGGLLKDVIAEVEVPDLAVMNIINGAGDLVPLKQMNYDSVKVDTRVGDNVYFEVVAQDGTTITYKLEPATTSSDAFVISTIYEVDQTTMNIRDLADGTTVSLFFKNIEVAGGANALILSKLGHERIDGYVAYDDVLQVVSEDGTNTVTYFITFLNETTPDSNGAPEITLAFSDSTIAVPGTLMLSATATDDGLPPPAALTYLWEVTSDNAADVVIDTPDALETNVTFAEKAEYTLTLSVSDGDLTSQADVNVTVGIVGIDPSLAPAVKVFPNPVGEKLSVTFENLYGTVQISVCSMDGKVVSIKQISDDKVDIDMAGFDAGVYFIKVNAEAYSATHRVVKLQ